MKKKAYGIHLPKQETEYFISKLQSCKEYLEYGSGGSTYFASSIPNLKVYSVESDKDFKENLEKDIENNPDRKNNPKLYHVDIGKTSKWGFPTKKTSENKKHLFKDYPLSVWDKNPMSVCLSTFSTDAAGKLDVLWHNGDTLGVDGAQVGIFEKTNQVSFRCFLESHDGARLETQVSLEVLGNFTDKTLEGQLADQELSRFLVTTDLTKSHCTWTVSVGLLDSSGGGSRLSGSLGCQLFTGSLSSGGFASGLLGTSHSVFLVMYV